MKYDIWCEGFSVSGGSGPAFLMYADVEAPTFELACAKMLTGNPNFRRETLTYWACRLFNNEEDARKAFG